MLRQLVRGIQGRTARQLHSSSRHLGGGKSAFHIPASLSPAISSFNVNEAALKIFACFEMKGRSFATRATKDLIRVLNAEVSHEKKNYVIPEAVENGPPSGWSIELRPGAAEIYLRRSFEDEDILVVVAQHDPFEEEEVEEEVVVDTEDKEEPNEKEELDDNEEVEDNEEPLPAMPISASITITKDGDKPALEFVTRVEDDFIIESIRHDTFGSEDHVTYEPVFSDLDERVANAFVNYLEERGVNDELAAYIHTCMSDKEQQEYLLWMKNIAKFLES